MNLTAVLIILLGSSLNVIISGASELDKFNIGPSSLISKFEDQETFNVGTEISEYDEITDDKWNDSSSENKCRLILEKLENEYKKSITDAKNNLVLISILRPLPIDDLGSCFKRLVLWHYEKVELIKSDPNIKNYEDIVPVRLLLLGLSPNQIDKEPRDLAEIPEFLEIACKNLLSQKPRMRWPLSGARYHPYIANIIGFQKVWIYRTIELLSACAQHTYQFSNGYLLILLVSVEHIVDNNIFSDYENAWKGRSDKIKKEEVIIDLDGEMKTKSEKKSNKKIIEFEIPDNNLNNRGDSAIEIEEVIKPKTRTKGEQNKITYSPNRLPVYEIPNSVSSEICAEVGTREIPGLSNYRQIPGSNNQSRYYSSIIIPSNRGIENPIYTPIKPEDRASLEMNEYRNFWLRPNYVDRYSDIDKLENYLLKKTHLNWPETNIEDILNMENVELLRPRNNMIFKDDVFEIYPNDNNDILQIAPSSSGMLNMGKLTEESGHHDNVTPLIRPYHFPGSMERYQYDKEESDLQTQKYAYFDNDELPEEERTDVTDNAKTLDVYFPYKKISPVDNYNYQPNLKLNYQGLSGKAIGKHPSFTHGYESMAFDNEIESPEDSGIQFSKFRNKARNAVVRWYIDENNKGDTHLTGRDRRILKKLFTYIDQVDPDYYEEYIKRGDDYIVRNILRIGKSKDKNFDRMLSTLRKNNRRDSIDKYDIYSESIVGTKIKRNKEKIMRSPLSRRNAKNMSKKDKAGRKSKKRNVTEISINEGEDSQTEEIYNIPKDIFIKDIIDDKYDFQNILKKERLKRYHKILKDEIEKRMSKIESKERQMMNIDEGKTLKTSLDNERKNIDKLENEYKKNLEEHAKILDLLKKNQEKLKIKMEEEHKKREDNITHQMEMALDTASNAINEVEKENAFLNNKLKTLEGDNKHIRSLINMKDNYIKKLEKDRLELESKRELEMREMKENYEKELSELKKNLNKDDTISGLSSMLSNLEYEAKKKLEKIDDIALNEEKIKRSVELKLKEREKQLELAYQKQKNRDTEYLNYVIELLESKESEEANRVIDELKNKILELEEKQDELNHTREELEMINDDLMQTVEDQNTALRDLMKKSEDIKVQRETALEELNIAKSKLEDVKQVEDRLRQQLEEVKKNGAPSDEILRHLEKSLRLAEEEKELALKIVENAEINYGKMDKNMKIASNKLDNMKNKIENQKTFENELRSEINKRYNMNRNALKSSESRIEDNDIRSLNDKETEELSRLRGLGLDELTDEEKKRLLMLGQRQLATMEFSVVKKFSELNNRVTGMLDDEEKEKSNILWEQASDTKISRMELENSIGDMLFEKIQGQEETMNNMKNLLEETQNTITELNKRLLLQRELSEEASANRNSQLQIYDEKENKGKDEESNIFEDEMSNDIAIPIEENSVIDSSNEQEKSRKLFMKELESKLGRVNEQSQLKETGEKSGKPDVHNKIIDEEGSKSIGFNNNLGRMEHSTSPTTIQKMIMHESMVFDKKETLLGDTKYEIVVNKHDNPMVDIGESGSRYDVHNNVYMLHDVQKERKPSKTITCENIVATINRNLNQYMNKFDQVLKSDGGNIVNYSEVMSRTVLPGMQYDECYNSTIIAFENFQEAVKDRGIQIKLFVLLTDFKDTLMIGDLSKTGYKMSSIPELVLRVLKDTGQELGGKRIETVINNFPSEWIHEHMRTCKDLLSGKSLESITSSSSKYNNALGLGKVFSFGSSSRVHGNNGINQSNSAPHVLQKEHPPMYVSSIEITPRLDKEPCVRLVKRIKQRVSEISGLLMKRKELQERLKISDAKGKLFVFTFEDVIPYDLSNQFTVHYCEKYVTDLFIKINNMEWRANKFKNSNSLIRLILIPTISNLEYTSDNIVNLEEWKSEGIRLSFSDDIVNNWMGNSLTDYLTNKKMLRSGFYYSDEMAKKIILSILDSINYYDGGELTSEHGAENVGRNDLGLMSSNSNYDGVGNSYLFGNIENENQDIKPNTEKDGNNSNKKKVIPGILLILRTSDKIPENTIINPTLLDLGPGESPYLIETVRNGDNNQE